MKACANQTPDIRVTGLSPPFVAEAPKRFPSRSRHHRSTGPDAGGDGVDAGRSPASVKHQPLHTSHSGAPGPRPWVHGEGGLGYRCGLKGLADNCQATSDFPQFLKAAASNDPKSKEALLPGEPKCSGRHRRRLSTHRRTRTAASQEGGALIKELPAREHGVPGGETKQHEPDRDGSLDGSKSRVW